jgi:hypothetical protein
VNAPHSPRPAAAWLFIPPKGIHQGVRKKNDGEANVTFVVEQLAIFNQSNETCLPEVTAANSIE